jgi:RHS repeat-associated protein
LVVSVTDGTVVQRVMYDEFGRELENTNPGFQPFGFAGGLNDEQANLVRFGVRDLDPVLGRWTSPDPISFGGGINLYEYVGSDPVGVTDPEGLGVCQLSTRLGQVTVDESIALRALFFLERAVALGYEGNVRSSFRTYEHQRRLFEDPRYNANDPERGSQHQGALAVDLDWRTVSPKSQAALLQAGETWGFRQVNTAGHPEHWFGGYEAFGNLKAAIKANGIMCDSAKEGIPACKGLFKLIGLF